MKISGNLECSKLCDLNCSVRGRVSGHLRTLIRGVGHLQLKVQRCPTPKILLFSSWYFIQIGWWESVGHIQTLSQRCPMLRIKVWRCPETRTRAGNSSSYWAIQNPLKITDSPLVSTIPSPPEHICPLSLPCTCMQNLGEKLTIPCTLLSA